MRGFGGSFGEFGEIAPPVPAGNGLEAMSTQFGLLVKKVLQQLVPFVDQPLVRFPFNMPLTTSAVIAAGATNVQLLSSDFNYSLEWPFEIHKIIFSNDPAHTFRNWRCAISDLVINQTMFKSPGGGAMVATLVEASSGIWKLDFPWVIAPRGGGLIVSINNLDATNPITVDINFQGYLLMPR